MSFNKKNKHFSNHLIESLDHSLLPWNKLFVSIFLLFFTEIDTCIPDTQLTATEREHRLVQPGLDQSGPARRWWWRGAGRLPLARSRPPDCRHPLATRGHQAWGHVSPARASSPRSLVFKSMTPAYIFFCH